MPDDPTSQMFAGGLPGAMPSNRVVPLDAFAGFRYLIEGEINLFVVASAGRRVYLLTLAAGEILPGMPAGEVKILAVPVVDTRFLGSVPAAENVSHACREQLMGKLRMESEAPGQPAALPSPDGLLEEFARRVLFEDARRERRREQSRESDERRSQSAIGAQFDRLRSLVADTAHADATDDPMGRILRILAKRYALPYEEPELSSDLAADADARFRACAEANHWRFRKVRFGEGFFRDLSEPLVGFKADGQPVILDAGGRHYLDPGSGRTHPLDAPVASNLRPHGYQIYRTFPDRKVAAADIWKLLFSGSGGLILAMAFAGLLAGGLGLVQPIATEYVTGKIIPTANSGELWNLLVLMVALSVSSTLLNVVPQLLLLVFGSRQMERFQAALFDRLFRLPVNFFRRYEAGDLCMRVLAATRIQEQVFTVVSQQFLSSLFGLANAAMLFYYSPGLAAAGVAGTLVYAAAMLVFLRGSLKPLARMAASSGRQAALLKQMFDGIGKIRAAAAEKRMLARFMEDFIPGQEAAFSAAGSACRVALLGIIFPAALSILFFYLVGDAWRSQMPLARFLAFMTAFAGFSQGILGISSGIWELWSVGPEIDRFKPILDEIPEILSGSHAPGKLDGKVELSHVTFRYSPESQPVLRDVSLVVSPGEFVAIVGPSGAGKSSVVRLLLGFETPEAGSILYGGQDLANLDVRAVRRQIGCILQNGRIIPGSILENIAMGTGCLLAEAEEAARMASLDADLRQMPMGMFTMVADGLISGGQQQRILIARALAGRPAILIMDEATSALDNATQETVSTNVERLKITRIVIAHRLSTIRNADRIYVLADGEIRQAGTYGELIAQDGLFRNLIARQLL
ncbi:MAG: ATP-binding cassette domain-containing protein [Verrucomicrobiae bacterium]